MHKKKFQQWVIEKEGIHNTKTPSFSPRIREIVYAKMGINIGFESDGKKNFIRPVLILAKIGSLYWVLPLTSKLKENFFHHTLQSVSFDGVKNSVVMLSQAKIIDEKRFEESIGTVSKTEFKEIQKKMKSMYFPS